MKQHANRLALQHLINAYAQETGRGHLILPAQQDSVQQKISQHKPLLCLKLRPLNLNMMVPLDYASQLGRHRIAAEPWLWQDNQWRQLSPVLVANLLLEDIVQSSRRPIDAASVLERWVQSRDAVQYFLQQRAQTLDELVAPKQSFIFSEQALLAGHAMHPTPKSRQGFMHEEFVQYSPETQGQCQLHFWLVAPDYIAESSADNTLPTATLRQLLKPVATTRQQALMQQYPQWKLLPLHPWQARYLSGKDWWQHLLDAGQLVDLGRMGWQLSPTTSIRTLAAINAPWMFKPSLSVAITNSIRVNQAHECLRGETGCRLWRSEFGAQLQQDYPTLAAINDPAWIALHWQGKVVNETICILRDNPFDEHVQVSCMASLCQDHPIKPENRLQQIIATLAMQENRPPEEIATDWFARFLQVAVEPMLGIYMRFGMAFEAHQQNTLLELNQLWPSKFWLRDNQGFYYIEEYAQQIIELFPVLATDAQSVGPKSFVDERVIYYLFGNTIFGLINALGATGFIDETTLLQRLQYTLQALLMQYPESTLLHWLLTADTLPYKGNLLTRLHELDELLAPLEFQSVYVNINNPLKVGSQQEQIYA
ncbi:IucA/IucC family protein [Alkanindiges illinoisensis]|uniref:IucA/IucC family protein n=1 Tax=Alkanindiges illinoisensis TaxID=197183 RepID=UPI00047D61DF|nr:IucA/IucC family protein [Alkanindiges illinoisensis]